MTTPNGTIQVQGTLLPSAKIQMYVPPKPVGFWVMQYGENVPYVMFEIYAKPTDEQIKNTEALLGWKWKDA